SDSVANVPPLAQQHPPYTYLGRAWFDLYVRSLFCRFAVAALARFIQACSCSGPSFADASGYRSEEHTSELQSLAYLVCRLLLEKTRRPPSSTLFPYTTLFRSSDSVANVPPLAQQHPPYTYLGRAWFDLYVRSLFCRFAVAALARFIQACSCSGPSFADASGYRGLDRPCAAGLLR